MIFVWISESRKNEKYWSGEHYNSKVSYNGFNAIICDIFYSSMIRELVQTKYRFVQSTDLITTGYRQEPTTGYYNDMKNYFVLLCQF